MEFEWPKKIFQLISKFIHLLSIFMLTKTFKIVITRPEARINTPKRRDKNCPEAQINGKLHG
jgi:hypothetical protein